MNDIADLLRSTLDDPKRRIEAAPLHQNAYRLRAQSLRWQRSVARAVAAATALMTIAGFVAISRTSGERSAALPQAGRSFAARVVPGPLSASELTAVPDAVAAQQAVSGPLLVLTSGGVVHAINTVTGADTVGGTMPLRAGVTPTGITVCCGVVWAWAADRPGSQLTRFTTGNQYDRISVRDSLTIPGYILSAAMLSGDLWLGTPGGLYRIGANSTTPELVAGYPALAIAADQEHDQLLLGLDPDVIRYDPVARKEMARAHVELGKISLALTGNGQLSGRPATTFRVRSTATSCTSTLRRSPCSGPRRSTPRSGRAPTSTRRIRGVGREQRQPRQLRRRQDRRGTEHRPRRQLPSRVHDRVRVPGERRCAAAQAAGQLPRLISPG